MISKRTSAFIEKLVSLYIPCPLCQKKLKLNKVKNEPWIDVKCQDNHLFEIKSKALSQLLNSKFDNNNIEIFFNIGNTYHNNFSKINGIIYLIYALNNNSDKKKLLLCGYMNMKNWSFIENKDKKFYAISTYDKLKQNSFEEYNKNLISFK